MIQIEEFQKSIANLKVLILGDLMLDHYLYGKADRISPEAPVPVVALERSEHRIGGAGNVALNIKSLGAKAMLCGMVGQDQSANELFDALSQEDLDQSWIVESSERPTTKKSRILANKQHLLRVDEESCAPLTATEEKKALEKVSDIFNNQKPDVLIFQDYNKGFLTPTLIAAITKQAAELNIPIVVDPKFDNFHAYKGADLFKPNLKEFREGIAENIAVDASALHKSASHLVDKMQLKSLMITLSEHGIYIFENGQGNIVPTYQREIVDVCGAGDAVIAICAVGLATGLDLNTIGRLANLAGGMVCESSGVVPISTKSYFPEIQRLNLLLSRKV